VVNEKENNEGLFTIGIVAKMVDINPQTLRIYERKGLIVPVRSDGNTRLYSRENVERIRMIVTLTRELDVNLAGVEVIMNLLERMQNLEVEFGNVIKQILERIMSEFDLDVKPEEEALIPLSKKSTKLWFNRRN